MSGGVGRSYPLTSIFMSDCTVLSFNIGSCVAVPLKPALGAVGPSNVSLFLMNILNKTSL